MERTNSSRRTSIYNYQETTQKTNTTFFYLDRAIYRPGQIVYFKGLMIETDGRKIINSFGQNRLQLLFTMPNYQKITDASSQLMSTEHSTEVYDPLARSVVSIWFQTKMVRSISELKNTNDKVWSEVRSCKRKLFTEWQSNSWRICKNLLRCKPEWCLMWSYRVVRTVYFPYYDFRWRGGITTGSGEDTTKWKSQTE